MTVSVPPICSQTSLPCVDSVVLDVERLGVSQSSGSQRAPLSENNQPAISLEPLSPTQAETTPRTPDITIAVTSKNTQQRLLQQVHTGATLNLL